MLSHMKTTIVLPDDLFAQVKDRARSERSSIKSFIERAVRHALEEANVPRPPFRLRDGSVGGEGLSPAFTDADWSELRAVVYEDRGG